MAKKAATKRAAADTGRARATNVTTSVERGELAAALREVNTAYPNTVRRASLIQRFNCIPTGAFALDYALQGGIPEGLGTIFFGWEGSGKTTVSIGTVREMQKKHPDKMVLWVDAERTFDREWAARHGVDIDRCYVVEPDTGQQAIDIITRFHDVMECCGIVVDSIPALVSAEILRKSASDATMAELARMCGVMCSKSTAAWATQRKRGHYVTMVIINQLRDKIGSNSRLPSFSQPGGHQLQYFVTTRIKLTGREVLSSELKKADATQYGLLVPDENEKSSSSSTPEFIEHTFHITKAKIGASMRKGDFRMNVNPQNPMLSVGQYDDAKIAMLFAKRVGLLQGSAGRYTLYGVTAEGQTFRTFLDMEQWLCKNPRDLLTLKQILIAALRLSKESSPLPEDGYLLEHVDERSPILGPAHAFAGSAVELEPIAEDEVDAEA